MTNTFDYTFAPTSYFLSKSAQIIAGFTYKCAFTRGFTPSYYGDGESKFFTNELPELKSVSNNSITENINFTTQVAELSALAQTQTQEIDITKFAQDIDGVFLYTGSQAAFFAPIENFVDIKKSEESALEFYPSKDFAWKVFTENIFSTTTNYYYLGFGSVPMEYSGDFLEFEITDKDAEEKTPLARACMSNASFLWNESSSSMIASFPDVVHFGGTETQPVNIAFIVEQPREGEAKAIFAAPIENGVLDKRVKYTGNITLTTEWIIII